MRFEVIIQVKIHVVLFWNMKSYSLVGGYVCEDGGSMHLRNVGTHLPDYTVS
jgi:hypothetical protein